MSDEYLFNNRKLIGKVLSACLFRKSLSKSSFSKQSGISRPTLDRMLRGEVTSQTNFITHLNKILPVLGLTMEDLFEKNCAYSSCREKSLFSPLKDSDESMIEICLQSGKKAFFRASIGFPDVKSGEIQWRDVLDLEGEEIMAVLRDGTKIQINSV